MRYVRAAVSATTLVLFATALSAQKPDFAGKWTLDAEKTAAANPNAGGGGGGGGGGRGGRGGMMNTFTLTLDATSLTREVDGPNGPVKTVYKLDGSETTVPMGQGEAKAKAKWEGNTIVIETTRTVQDGTAVTTKDVYSVEDGFLVITGTRPGRGGGEPVTTKRFFKKG
jgi:hypothetical protein